MPPWKAGSAAQETTTGESPHVESVLHVAPLVLFAQTLELVPLLTSLLELVSLLTPVSATELTSLLAVLRASLLVVALLWLLPASELVRVAFCREVSWLLPPVELVVCGAALPLLLDELTPSSPLPAGSMGSGALLEHATGIEVAASSDETADRTIRAVRCRMATEIYSFRFFPTTNAMPIDRK